MNDLISSPHNPNIKNILKLQKSSERKRQNLFIVEGLRELKLAFEANYQLHSIFICPEIIGVERYNEVKSLIKKVIINYEISKAIFEKIAYRENSDGIIALAAPKVINLENIKLRAKPLVIVLESIEKPGNIGAILRTADAANVDAVIICNPKTDIYNPNVIRSSVGCFFTNQIATCSSEQAIYWLRKQNISIFPTHLNAKKFYHQVDFKQPSAIIMGTEDAGLSDKWLASDFNQIKIPMNGKIDSMNVSNATAIVVFEAMKQRDFRFE